MATATAAATSSTPLGIETWLRSVGVWWDTSLVHIKAGCSGCSGPALGVFAVTDVQENQLLCVIPRSAILSPRTTQLADILESEKLGGGLALSIAVMYEASLGTGSKWAGYIDSLPRREYLPLFWNDDELALLQGTALEGCAQDDRRDTEEDYNTHVVPLMARHAKAFAHPELCTLEHFRIAASWVASRCFYVDSWHGDAMVPLADIFNHKASLVLLDDAWKVAEEMDAQQQQPGDEHCRDEHRGSEPSDEEDYHADDEDEEEDEQQESQEEEASEEENGDVEEDEEEATDDDDPQHGFAVGGMPVITAAAAGHGGANTKAASSWVRDGVNLRLEIGICSLGPPDNTEAAAAAAVTSADETQDNGANHGLVHTADGESAEHQHCHHYCDDHDHCKHRSKRQRTEQQQQQQYPEKRLEIIAASSVPTHAEVHNTYGELSNAQLLHKYGFCLPQNPFDEVQLGPSWDWLLLEVAGLGQRKELKTHIEWLQQNRILAQHQKQQPEFDHEDEETPDPPAVSPGGRLPLITAAVLRVVAAPPKRLKQWNSLQDVIDQLKQQPADTPATAGAGTGVADADTALSEHFEDIRISDVDASYWGSLGMEVLIAGISEKLQRYPRIAADCRVQQQQQQPLGARAKQQQSSKRSKTAVEDCLDLITMEVDEKLLKQTHAQLLRQQQTGHAVENQEGDSAAEHVAAVSAALQLRICEQRILQQALLAIQHVLAGAEDATSV